MPSSRLASPSIEQSSPSMALACASSAPQLAVPLPKRQCSLTREPLHGRPPFPTRHPERHLQRELLAPALLWWSPNCLRSARGLSERALFSGRARAKRLFCRLSSNKHTRWACERCARAWVALQRPPLRLCGAWRQAEPRDEGGEGRLRRGTRRGSRGAVRMLRAGRLGNSRPRAAVTGSRARGTCRRRESGLRR